MTVAELKPEDQFKWKLRQREFRTVNKIIPVPDSPSLPEHYKGGLIIVTTECRTITMQPSDEVIIKSESCTAKKK